MNHYPHHVGDYLKDTAHLSLLEHGCYRRMLDVYYTRERPLPADDGAVCRLVGAASKDEKRAVVVVLKEFFSMGDDGWHNKRADAEIAAYKDKAGKASASAKTRWSKSERNANASPNALRTHSEGNANQNQEPEPIKEKAQRADPPLAEQPPTPPPTVAVAIAVELRRRGVKVNGAHPTVQAWGNEGFTLPAVVEALELARMSKPEPEDIPVNYIDRILRNPPKKAEPAWWSSDQRILAKGAELGLNPRPGEEMAQFKSRIQDAMGKRKEAA